MFRDTVRGDLEDNEKCDELTYQWLKTESNYKHETTSDCYQIKELKCTSAACALGTAACNETFIKEGLKLIAFKWEDVNGDAPIKVQPYYQGQIDYQAGKSFFGLDDFETKFLFSPSSYMEMYPYINDQERAVDETDVIDRINYLLEGGIIDHYSQDREANHE